MSLHLPEEYKKYLKNLYEYIMLNKTNVKLNLKDNLIYCGIAGRVCYSSEIKWVDKRLNEELIQYLNRLSKWTHYSVFAHIPIEIHIDLAKFVKYELYNLFKMKYDKKKEILYINLRHILESFALFNRGTIEEIIKEFYDINDFKYRTINDLKYKQVDNVYYFDINEYRGFFYIKNIDRVTTHQIVRHQKLDYNQQSQRYVKLKDIIIPDIVLNCLTDKYNDKQIEEYKEIYFDETEKYKYLLDNGFTAEDARGILPMTSQTNIVISGYKEDIQKFIEDRLDNKAQCYIRQVAKMMKKAMEK